MPRPTLSDLSRPETTPIDTPDQDNPARDAGPRFHCTDLPDAPGATVALNKDQARHAAKVLRLSVGDPVQLLDGRGAIAQATLAQLGPPTTCTIRSVTRTPARSPHNELAVAIPKGPRADSMINDLAQLGADRLIPLITERSVVHPRDAKLDRFAKASAEAGKQSGNTRFMQIDEPTPLAHALHSDADLKLIADPSGKPLADVAPHRASVKAVRVLVGPEGGFTDQELDEAKRAGFVAWCYSANILRIETAACAAVAILRSHTQRDERASQ